ncbi:MAG: dihydroxyacetone kinase subunit L [Planctomycetaceae bacterium]|nr:dihydroxyacetone kinase subunit L [Planctomycetaceae bacterium]
MSSFSASNGSVLLNGLVETIQKNKAYLSEIDGAIGDGDHGINMNKGFSLYQERYADRQADVSTALQDLGRILLTEIGGSMGPIYGTFFIDMAKACRDAAEIDAELFSAMLGAALEGVQELGDAKRGDKTLLDTLIPAREAFAESLKADACFTACLEAMRTAAKAGWKSTKEMQARIGRASRLGERSIGTVDAGATSCLLILSSLADNIEALLK